MTYENKMTTSVVAGNVAFAELCGLLERLQKMSGNDKKKRILKDFVDKWRQFHDDVHKDDKSTTDSFYPAMRLLLPHLDKERLAYGIKEHTFAKLLIEVLCLGKDSSDAHRLLHYKAPKSARAEAGDFASVAYFVLKNRCPDKGSLSIEEVNKDLDAIAVGNAAKNRESVRRHLLHLLTNLTATEQKWLIRMIMKELKVGLSQASVLGVFHPDAEELYNVNNRIDKVCRLLHDPNTRAHEIGISIFSPFSPMLGEKGTPDKVEQLMDNKTYFIETKYDGERVLLHKNGDEYKYFSRSGKEYTHVFGSNSFEGTLTPYIASCFNSDVEKCILDGEMLGYHAATDTFGTKGEQFDIKAQDCAARTGYQPCVQVFDVLLLNDKVLTNVPLKDRLPQLEKVFTPVDGRIIRSEYTAATSNQECADALNEAIDNKEEGIMVKLADSVYRPNTRRGGWFKIKPEYIGGLTDELDVLIVGGYFGAGHRGGIMSHFLCAVAVPPTGGGAEPDVFHSFCKVGSGYSKKQLRELNNSMADHWKIYDKRSPPQHLILASGFKEKPDVWLPPDKSMILQIKAAEIILSEKFKTGCTLRFPRVEVIRDDKPWHQCMTTKELEDLREKSGGKLAGKYELTDTAEPVKKKRKVVSRAVKPTLMAQFKGADTTQVEKVSEILAGKEFCVINGPALYPKHELEKKIAEIGGSIVQNPDDSTLCIIADKVAVRVNNLIKKNKYDIVKASWLIRVIEAAGWIPWSPADMIHTTTNTQKVFTQNYDAFGDSYTNDTSEDNLRDIFTQMKDFKQIDGEAIAEMEEKYFPDDSPYGLFRTCRFYLDNNLLIGDISTRMPNSPLDLIGLELRFFGGRLCDELDESISHVLVDERNMCRLSQLKEIRRERKRKFHIVTEKWMHECVQDGTLCNERLFEP